MKKKLATIVLCGLVLSLTGCGGNGATLGSGGGSGSTSGGGASSGSGSSTTVELGTGSGGSFKQGVLNVSVSNLSAGGSTDISASLETSSGTAYTQPATVTFTSACYQSGLAAFSNGNTATNSVSTSTGQADIVYQAQGCSGSDTITATTTVAGNTLQAQGSVTVAASSVGSIEFVSANPSSISLQGGGGQTSSTIVFKVLDASGNPVPNAHVQFSPNTTVGGITLSPASATTGKTGEAQTVLQAGTQHTTVRITAQTTGQGGTTISTQSPGIAISTGLPTEKHFSLSVASHAVAGAFDIDGLTDKVTVILSDRYGNPVPDGTSVAFTTNAGQIQPSCVTTNGECHVTWTSSNPRPMGPPSDPLSVLGHAEVLAYTTGEESYTDANGDGVIDQGDQFSLYPGASGSKDQFLGVPSQDDIGEVYMDQNENGKYDPGEFFFDFNKNGQRDGPDHQFHGYGCKSTNNPPVPCGGSSFGVGEQSCILMVTKGLVVDTTNQTSVSAGTTYTYPVTDTNGNSPAGGTSFSISGPASSSVTVNNSPVSSAVDCGSAPYQLSISVSSSAQSGSTFQIVAKDPQSGQKSYSNTITVK